MGYVLITVLIIIFVLLPAGAYAYWVWKAVAGKRWRLVTGQIAAPIVILLTFKAGLYWQNQREIDEYWRGLFSVSVEFGEPIFQYHSQRAFNGDGYSIEVFALPDVLMRRFQAVDKAFLTEYPKRPGYREHWKPHAWSQAPFDSSLKQYLEFAEMGGRGYPGVDLYITKVRDVLAKSTTYYAFFYNQPGDYLGDVDFFVVDLEARLFYAHRF